MALSLLEILDVGCVRRWGELHVIGAACHGGRGQGRGTTRGKPRIRGGVGGRGQAPCPSTGDE